jgi:hypothetical protein
MAMTVPSLLERAKAGDAEAIVVLLNQSLQAKGVTVRGECQGYILTLWLEGQRLPPQAPTVAYVRRGLERLLIPSIGIVQIYGQQTGAPAPAWNEEISLLGAFADGEAAPWENGHGAAKENEAPRPSTPANPPPPHSEPEPSPATPAALHKAYNTLELDPGTSLAEVKSAYFKHKAQLIGQGNRQAIADLKAAYQLLQESLQQYPITSSDGTESDAPQFDANALAQQLQSRGLKAQVKVQGDRLQVRLPPTAATQPNRAVAMVYTLLDQIDLTAWGMADLTTVVIYSQSSGQSPGWKRTLAMPSHVESPDDTDLLSFKNRYVSALGFPVLMVLGILMNAMPIVNALLFGVKIWFHEFGHAVVAWLGGRRAIPLPFGWTNVSEQRSLFVYVGVLLLLGLMFWVGRREKRRWPMVLAVVLAVIQFFITWILPEARFLTLLSFGGIGGELYLCTLLMISFFFSLPDYWRWDFYRYPVVLGASFTFWGQFWRWRQIRRGLEPIPWGSLWGGAEHGDMNDLSYAGWSDQQIIDTYSTISHLCLIALLSVYIYFALRQNRHYLFSITQHWLAR